MYRKRFILQIRSFYFLCILFAEKFAKKDYEIC